MLWLLKRAVERLKTLLVADAALDLEAQFLSRQADRRADLIRKADEYEEQGLHDLAEDMRRQTADLSIERPLASVLPALDRFRPRYETGEAVFCAVDKITARTAIWRMIGKHCRFWGDGRLLAETIRVLTASTEEERTHYATTLFSASEAEPGRCTARSTIYTANLCAALMIHQFTRWLRGLPLDRDLSLSLLASEMVLV